AAADEVSALTAARFSAHAQTYHAMSAQAALIHELFVSTLAASRPPPNISSRAASGK
ncbi:PE family protein, partial [Mycobacterium gordonae]|uniref:PE family protein n=1 Tax=Mycobacterium gordonae TaxID=1778 RepID=UPI0012E9F03C